MKKIFPYYIKPFKPIKYKGKIVIPLHELLRQQRKERLFRRIK